MAVNESFGSVINLGENIEEYFGEYNFCRNLFIFVVVFECTSLGNGHLLSYLEYL